MGSIELKMAILTGAVVGLLMVVIEGVAIHRKVSAYRTHLRVLYLRKRFYRLFAEICGIAFVVLIQPLIISALVAMALDNLNPKFSAHVMAQLKQGIYDGDLKDDRPFRQH